MKRTINEIEARGLERLARKHERELRFARHSPRSDRWLPFDKDAGEPASLAEAVVWTAVCALLVAFMFLMLGIDA